MRYAVTVLAMLSLASSVAGAHTAERGKAWVDPSLLEESRKGGEKLVLAGAWPKAGEILVERAGFAVAAERDTEDHWLTAGLEEPRFSTCQGATIYSSEWFAPPRPLPPVWSMEDSPGSVAYLTAQRNSGSIHTQTVAQERFSLRLARANLKWPAFTDPPRGPTFISSDLAWQVAVMLAEVTDRAPLDLLLPVPAEADANVRALFVSGLAKAEGPEAMQALVAATGDRSPFVRATAVDALALHGTEALPQLAKALEDENVLVQVRAAEALGDHQAAARPLAEALASGRPAVRAAAAQALGRMDPAPAGEALAKAATEDPSATVRELAVAALGRIEGERVTAVLDEAARDDDRRVWHPALLAISKRGREGQAALLRLSRSTDGLKRAIALRQLSPEAADARERFVEALHDPHWSVRSVAAGRLGECEDEAVVPPLLQALHDRDPAVRASAAKALGRLEAAAALDDLRTALDDPDPDVQGAAAAALGRLKDTASVLRLISLAKSANERVSRGALRALKQIGSPRALDAVKELEPPDPFHEATKP